MYAPQPDLPATKRPLIEVGSSGRLTFGIGLALFLALWLWALLTPIGGAIVTSGSVAVPGKAKSVQHLDGGIVSSILVGDGDHVSRGDVIMRLDDTLLAANLEIYLTRLSEAHARAARLNAEAAGAETITLPEAPALLAGRDLGGFHAAEAAIFAAHADILAGRRAQLDEKIAQFGNQITGVDALVAAKGEQLAYLEKDIERFRQLHAKKLVRESDMLSLQSSRADLLGQISEHIAERARIENSIRDAEIEMIQAEREAREKAITELREVTTSTGELTEQVVSTRKQLDRVAIRAPETGFIHDLQIVTVGGVVPPGGVIAQVVSHESGMNFELQVAPTAVDQVFIGQDVRLLFPAFDQRTTPELAGKISLISPTTLTDKVTGMNYYLVTARVEPGELALLADKELVPGMPVEAFISTGMRSAASYFVKPFTDQLNRAFRED